MDKKNKQRISLGAALAVIALILVLVAAGPEKKQTTSSQLKIAATMFPIADMTKSIVGNRATVITILPPGASAHTYQPTPEAARQLQGTTVVFKIGSQLDDWVDTIAATAGNPRLVTVSDGVTVPNIELRQATGAGSGNVDPHYWLSPRLMKQVAKNIADTLCAIDQPSAAFYLENLSQVLSQLDWLLQTGQQELRGIKTRELVTFHEAWYYFAADYGLTIAATFEPFPGQEPTPQYLADLLKQLQDAKVTTLFTEPQLAADTVRQFAADQNMTLVELDPIGGVPGRQSYLELMRYNITTVATALQ